MCYNKEHQPLVSVIVPVYRVKYYLDRCVSSIVQQTYQNLEVILVDDGSPDECGAMCDRWAEQDARIKVIHKPNGGLSDARNAGIEAAQGEYLSFIDSDDYIEPEMIERLYQASERYDTPLAICNYIYEFELSDGDEPYKKYSEPDVYQIQEDTAVSCQTLTKWMGSEYGKYTFCVVAWNKLYARSLFEQIRYPVGKIHEDEYVFHQLIYLSQRIACVSYVGYHYLQRKNSIMADNMNYQDALEALLERCRFFLKKEEPEMAAESEKRLLGLMKRAKSAGVVSKGDSRIREYRKIVWRLYLKKWISFQTLGKRLVRLYLL